MRTILKSITCILLLSSAYCDVLGDLDSRQWAIKNNGQVYKRKIEEYNHEMIKGLKGIDLNLISDTSTLEKNSSETIVAVIDSGLDINHPELKSSIWENPDCKGKNEQQRIEEKLICNGVNVLTNTNELIDKLGHGTFAAGQIVALRDSIGVSGVTHSKIKIMPIKALDDKFYGFSSDGKLTSELIANGVVYATKNGARVINLSLGFPSIVVTPKVKASFDYAIDQGVVIVAAAGNNNKNKPVFPCNYSRVICVGAIDATGVKVKSSNFGHKVDLYAPGENIISTIPVGMESEILREANYDIKTGTSYSAPYVSALAALLISKDPSLTSKEVRNIIIRSSRDIGGVNIVDFSSALNNITRRNIVFNVKSIDEANLNSLNSFDLAVSLDSLVSINESDIAIKMNSSVLALDKFNLKKVGDDYQLNIRINALDLKAHSSQKIKIEVMNQNISESKEIEVELNVLAKDDEKKLVKSIPAKAIMTVNQFVKRSSLQRVLQRDPGKTSQDLFFAEAITDKIYLLKEIDQNYMPSILKLENKSAISAVMRVDINSDGVDDYFVYGASEDKKYYFLSFFDGQTLSPMFEKNYWRLKATRFGGLSFNKGFENFAYMNFDTAFGRIKLPVFQREWLISNKDNSTDPIDKLDNVLKKRVYYFEPVVEGENVELGIRSLNTFSNITKMRKLLEMEEFHHFDMNEVLLQDSQQLRDGVVNTVVNFGLGNSKQSALVEFKNVSEFKIINISSVNSEKNDFSRIRTIDDTYSKEMSFSKVFSRSLIRFSNFLNEKFNFSTKDWSDVLISTIDIFTNNNTKTYFIETRYNVFAVKVPENEPHVVKSLPVDRESGYPGLAFSQSFQSTLLADGQVGIFTDTKSIYGNTVGVLKFVDDKFLKPIESTYLIPDHCVSLGHTEIEYKGFLQLHCTDQNISWISRVEL